MKPIALTVAQIIGASFAVVFALPGCGHVKQTSPATLVYQAPGSRPSRTSQRNYPSFFGQKDYQRLVGIQQEISRTQQISDADVTFLIKELRLFPPQNTSPNSLAAANFVLSHTYDLKPKRLTPTQSHRLYDAIVPYTRTPDSATEVDAALALASTREPRAIGRLQNLTWSSPYPTVRLSAKDFLAQLRKVLTAPHK